MPRFLKARQHFVTSRGQSGRQGGHRKVVRGRDGTRVNTGKFKTKGHQSKRRVRLKQNQEIGPKKRGERESRKNMSAEDLDRDLESYWKKNDSGILQNHLDNDLDVYMQRSGKDEPDTVSKDAAPDKK